VIYVVNKYKHTPTEFDVKISRPSPLGNPFTSKDVKSTRAKYQSSSREESIKNFESYIVAKIAQRDKAICDELNKIYLMAKRGDVYLVCFCKPQDCHGDIIKKIVESKLA